jgi:hypothetical protein
MKVGASSSDKNVTMNKRFLYCIIIFMLCPFFSYSQFEYYKPPDTSVMKHFYGERSISISPNILINTPNGVQFAGGLKTRYFLSKRFSLDADIVVGRNYMHFGPGIIVIPFLLVYPNAFDSEYTFDSFGEFLFFLGFSVLSFEHVSYHIPLRQYADLSPYISLMRYKLAGENQFPTNNATESGQFTFNTGIELNKYFGRFFLSPYIEYNLGYRDHISGVNLGVNCGIYFPLNN